MGGSGSPFFFGGKCAGGGGGRGVRGRLHVGKGGCQYTRFFSSQDIDVPTNCKIFDSESLKLP